MDVGLIGVHFQDEGRAEGDATVFVEMVPWNSKMSWEVAPWGAWTVGEGGQKALLTALILS